MKRFLLFATLLSATILFVSCTSWLPKRFDTFVDKVEKNAPSYSEEDWDKVAYQFDSLIDNYEKAYDKLDKEQRTQIDKAIGRYHGLVLKSNMKNIIRSFDDAIFELSDIARGVMEGINSFINELVESEKE